MKDLYMRFVTAIWAFIVSPMIDGTDTFRRWMKRSYVGAFDGYYHKLVIVSVDEEQKVDVYDYSFSAWMFVYVWLAKVINPIGNWAVPAVDEALLKATTKRAASGHILLGLKFDDAGKETVHVIPWMNDAGDVPVDDSDSSPSKVDVVVATVDDKYDVTHAVESVSWMLRSNRAWTGRDIIRVLHAIFPRCADLDDAWYQDKFCMKLSAFVDGQFVEKAFSEEEVVCLVEKAKAEAWDNEF